MILMSLFDVLTEGSFQLKPTSIEKKVFPEMCRDGELFAMELPGKSVLYSLHYQYKVNDIQNVIRFKH